MQVIHRHTCNQIYTCIQFIRKNYEYHEESSLGMKEDEGEEEENLAKK